MVQGSPSSRARRGDGALLPDPGMRWGWAPPQPRGLTPSLCQVPGGVPSSTPRRIPSWRSKRRSSRSRLSRLPTPEAMAARWQGQVPNPVPVIAPHLPPPSKLHGARDTPNCGAGMELVRGSREHVWAWAYTCGTLGRCIYMRVHVRDCACDHTDVCTAGCAHGHGGTCVCSAGCLCNDMTVQCACVCPRRHGCVNVHTRMCQHLYVSTCGHIWQSPTCTHVGGRAQA